MLQLWWWWCAVDRLLHTGRRTRNETKCAHIERLLSGGAWGGRGDRLRFFLFLPPVHTLTLSSFLLFLVAIEPPLGSLGGIVRADWEMQPLQRMPLTTPFNITPMPSRQTQRTMYCSLIEGTLCWWWFFWALVVACPSVSRLCRKYCVRLDENPGPFPCRGGLKNHPRHQPLLCRCYS
jgi:hypothetical protein